MKKWTRYTVVLLTLISVVLAATSCASPTPTPTPLAKAGPAATPTSEVVASPTVAPTTTPVATPITVVSPTVAPTTAPAATSITVVSPTVAPTTAPAGLPTPTLASAGVPASYEEMQRISPEELKALIEGGADVVVVDTQPEGAYEMGHIPGAVNFPWAMEIEEPGGLPQYKLLILYCACAHEEDAGDVAMQLITEWDYNNIMLLDGGWLRWVELDYPVEK